MTGDGWLAVIIRKLQGTKKRDQIRKMQEARKLAEEFRDVLGLRDGPTSNTFLTQKKELRRLLNTNLIPELDMVTLGRMETYVCRAYMWCQEHHSPEFEDLGERLLKVLSSNYCKLSRTLSGHYIPWVLVCFGDVAGTRKRLVANIPVSVAFGYVLSKKLGRALIFSCIRHGDYTFGAEMLNVLVSHDCGLHRMRIYIGQERWSEAEAFALQVLERIQRPTALNPRWMILGFLGLLADAELGQGKLVEAEGSLKKAIQGRNEVRRPSSAFLLYWERLIGMYLDQERWNEAEDELKELIELKERMASKSSIPRGFSTYAAIPDLVRTSMPPLNKENVWAAARKLLPLVPKIQGAVEYKEGKERVLGLLLSLFKNYRQLANIYLRQGRYAEARPLLELVSQEDLHCDNPTLEGYRRDIKHYANICVDSEEWKDAEWLQELVFRDKEGMLSGPGSKLDGAVIDGAEIHQPLQLLSQIYRKTGSWSKMHDVNVRLLRYHTRPEQMSLSREVSRRVFGVSACNDS